MYVLYVIWINLLFKENLHLLQYDTAVAYYGVRTAAYGVYGSNCLSITQSLYVSQQRIAANVDNKLINAYISLESLHWDNC